MSLSEKRARIEVAGSRSRRNRKDSRTTCSRWSSRSSSPSPSRSGTVTWWVVSRPPSRTWTRNSRGARRLTLMSAVIGHQPIAHRPHERYMVVGELLMYPFHQARRAVQLRGERGSPVDSLQTRDAVPLGGRRWQLHRLDRLGVDHLPFTLKVLLENLLRHEDGQLVTVEQIEAVRRWDPAAERRDEVDLHPTRVFLHDTNGVPALVDLAAMRDALAGLGGDPR